MKIGIISDTHGKYDTWKRIIDSSFKNIDLIIHCGDILYGGNPRSNKLFYLSLKELDVPIVVAEGNCDRFDQHIKPPVKYSSPFGKIRIGEMTVIYTHGDYYVTPYSRSLCAQEQECDIFISGHTHIFDCYRDHRMARQ